MKQYDAIIIGFGKGGKLLAAELANRNWKVAIIERSPQMYGGTVCECRVYTHQSADLRIGTGRTALPGRLRQSAKYYALAIRRKNKLVSFLRDKHHERIKEHPQYYVV